MVVEYIFVKPKDDFCVDVEGFKNYLESNTRIKFDDSQVTIDKKKYKYKLSETKVDKAREIVFHLRIEPLNSASEIKQIENLENAADVLQRINDTYDMFNIYTVWDDISMYYNQKLYAPIEKIENQLRKIIYLFMTKTVGSKWTENNMPASVKDDIKRTRDKNEITAIDDDNLLYYADFIVLGKFFFGRYSLNNNYSSLIERIKKEEYRTDEKIAQLIEEFETKSNWERYFKDKIEIEELEEKWRRVYYYRNTVAHSKCIRKKDYDEASTLIAEIDSAFKKCIDLIDDVDFTEEESIAVEKVASATIKAPELSYSSSPYFIKKDIWGNYLIDEEKLTGITSPTVLQGTVNVEDVLGKNYLQELKTWRELSAAYDNEALILKTEALNTEKYNTDILSHGVSVADGVIKVK